MSPKKRPSSEENEMNKNNANPEEQYRVLLMKALDAALTEPEEHKFERLLRESPERRQEWESMRAIKSITNKMTLKEPEKEVWDMYWTNTYNRLERGLAWLLITIGAVLLTGYSGYVFFESFFPDPNIPIVVKGGVILLLGGLMALSLSVIREKIFTRKSDPYKEVQR